MKHSIKSFPFSFLVLGLLLCTLFLLPSYEAYADPIIDVVTLDVEDQAIASANTLTQTKHITGTIDGANYEIKVPAGWSNGTLMVFAHGYSPKTSDGGVDDGNATHPLPGLDEELLSKGYALAGSGYRDRGWAVEEGISDTLALTNHFSQTFGAPSRTILWGLSMGSAITFKSIELYPDVYDGAIGGCAIGAGSSMMWDAVLALALAYDVGFGWPEDEWGPINDVRDDITFRDDVLPVLTDDRSDPNYEGKREFIRRLSGIPNVPVWYNSAMTFATIFRAELEQRASGSPLQNENHVYTLSPQDKKDLKKLGIDADKMLGQMNARTNIKADPGPRSYIQNFADYTYNITKPVITLHTIQDQIVIVANESVYKEAIMAAGKSDLLYQVYSDGDGSILPSTHCLFTKEQLSTTLLVMDKWLDDIETPPTKADFPTDLHFVHDFEPPPWPITLIDASISDPTNLSLTEFGQSSVPDRAWFALLPMLIALAGFLYLRRRQP